jgi:sterol desaturase/sphingolipid hydroxylase (fatty acid hydroxylase superfamily)
MPYTDTNFGNIFSFWDKLLGTYAAVDNRKLVYGVDTHMDTADHSNIGQMLKIPFVKRETKQYDEEEVL